MRPCRTACSSLPRAARRWYVRARRARSRRRSARPRWTLAGKRLPSPRACPGVAASAPAPTSRPPPLSAEPAAAAIAMVREARWSRLADRSADRARRKRPRTPTRSGASRRIVPTRRATTERAREEGERGRGGRRQGRGCSPGRMSGGQARSPWERREEARVERTGGEGGGRAHSARSRTPVLGPSRGLSQCIARPMTEWWNGRALRGEKRSVEASVNVDAKASFIGGEGGSRNKGDSGVEVWMWSLGRVHCENWPKTLDGL